MISYSLSSNPITEQILGILNTASRRYNMSCLYDDDTIFDILLIKNAKNMPVLTPLDLHNNLVKYNPDTIKIKFPHFVKPNRAYFDTIYSIKTENPHLYVNATENVLCDTILICCTGKKYNIMFELDKSTPYFNNLDKMYNEQQIECIYNNPDI